ncbi:MAG: polysaccharide export protein [Gemmatimonadota bacterium]|nr:MAG: polysaccharide export protein [Gemmatimonadota bacterium]
MMGFERFAVARWLSLAAVLTGLGACGPPRLGVPLAQLRPEPLTTVRPGDVIEIEFWQQAELSGERIVDDNGRIHLPLVRDVEVGGLSAEEIRERLTQRYGQYYADPLIVVNVRLGVSITGAVQAPGRYTVDPALNMLDLLGLAGGLQYEANRDRIELNRDGHRYQINLDDALLATQPETLRLQSGDWIYVPRRFWTLQRTATYATITVLLLTIANFFVN